MSDQQVGKLTALANWSKSQLAAPVVTAVIGAVVTLWLTSSSPYLRVDTGEVFEFTSENEEFGLFVVSIRNEGNEVAEKVTCEIDLVGCKIQGVMASPSALRPEVVISEDTERAVVNIPSINSDEAAQVAIKASNPRQLTAAQKITVRGYGVNGVEGVSPASVSWLWPFLLAVMGIASGLFTVWGTTNLLETLESRKIVAALRNPKKRLRFIGGPMHGKLIAGTEANDLIQKLTMRGERLEVESAQYRRNTIKSDDDGTVEITFLSD